VSGVNFPATSIPSRKHKRLKAGVPANQENHFNREGNDRELHGLKCIGLPGISWLDREIAGLVAAGVVLRGNQNQARAGQGRLRGGAEGVQDADDGGVAREDAKPNG
jgi:hypothetical protein